MIKKWNAFLVFIFLGGSLYASSPRFSVAGFYPLENTGREVFSMNPGWRFYKGDAPGAFQKNFDDAGWNVVSLPNGIEELPVDASGSVNYQGIVWYRKHFTVPQKLKEKKLFLHFEAIMGKSKIWVNGKLVKENFGGYLPIIIDVTPHVDFEKENIVSIQADNSDDPKYPPGKSQSTLDFTYLGGIYRDVWLVAHRPVFITDANYAEKAAGGGLFISFSEVSEKQATIRIDAEVKNETLRNFRGKVVFELYDKNNKRVASAKRGFFAEKNSEAQNSVQVKVDAPHLWSPETPYLYNLKVYVKDLAGNTVDGYRKRVGIRSIAFKGKKGFWLNGRPYGKPLIGANRHQDFAVVGNALSNSLHWRDALKLRRAGLKVVRSAHYPQDPAFMDACDELGIFVIVATPGWQFWSDDFVFEQRIYSDIRNMVRRDRNHPSVWLWEPILNETWYPDHFAKKAKEIVDEEYPYPYNYSVCDLQAKGSNYFPVLYMHPINGDQDKVERAKNYDESKSYFTREWGDNVDDWDSHNSPSRAARNWGEEPMLVQAQHYASPPYSYTSYETLFRQKPQHVGGALWHPFDHQRGYHPDPFYGGIMDAFRQPKLSYHMFASQRNPEEVSNQFDSGPLVYISHAMTPFSPADVTVYSNCDEVRLTVFKNGNQYVHKRELRDSGMLYPIITFKNVFDIMQDKQLARQNKHNDAYLLAQGYIGGELVTEHKIFPARRPAKLLLWADSEQLPLQADGGDLLTIVAAVADDKDNIKRLSNEYIYFEIEGEGSLVGSSSNMLNPVSVQWGTAPILLRAHTNAGKIKIKASVLKKGAHVPLSAELIIRSKIPDYPMIYSEQEIPGITENEK